MIPRPQQEGKARKITKNECTLECFKDGPRSQAKAQAVLRIQNFCSETGSGMQKVSDPDSNSYPDQTQNF